MALGTHQRRCQNGSRLLSWAKCLELGNRVLIGNNVKIQNNVSVYDNVTLEDDVFCGPSMVFTNVYNPRSAVSRKNEFRDTLVKKGATMGANCTVICRHSHWRICLYCCRAVVNRNVKAYALMAGVPARQIGWMCAPWRAFGFAAERKF